MAADGPEAEALVKRAAADAAASFAGGPFSREVSRDKITALVGKYGDIAYESELILGRYWRKATPGQKDAFVSLLIPFFVATYAELIDNSSGSTQVEVLGSEERADGVLVKTRMILSPQDSVVLSFVIVRNPAGRLVVSDVIAEGAGLLTTIRSDFTSVVRNAGGNIEVLLDAMRRKIETAPPPAR
ncbi:MlaC/ttg2D family ABC transporter substrate-binding protein [Paramagnetospirillum caucaseum]|uniref:MlaC/ttg2D family ABC transporter substrate-binding protein n=1 Tax=Paramagnetospirillum caucaseum TaxID=1244869 RepID=UPI0009D9AF64|nr:ABC transporter substrate-binding protein [Paramagnetospirillum caucaseum]